MRNWFLGALSVMLLVGTSWAQTLELPPKASRLRIDANANRGNARAALRMYEQGDARGERLDDNRWRYKWYSNYESFWRSDNRGVNYDNDGSIPYDVRSYRHDYPHVADRYGRWNDDRYRTGYRGYYDHSRYYGARLRY